jgi:hypothetical protein
MPDDPTIPDATCPPFSGATQRDLLAGILLASGGDPADIPNTTQCREWGYGRYTERDLLAAILLATGSGGAEWGLITGTLSDQTDLQTALNGKLGVSAQAADVNPAGTAIAAALGAKLNLTGGTLTGALNFSGTTHAGLRLNNLTTVERDAVASPLAGMTVWNTTTSRMNIHDGSVWTNGFVRLAGDTMTGALGVTLTSLGTTPTAGFTLANTTAAGPGAGAQQVSPSLVLEGQGWKTAATADSQPVQYHFYTLPVQGTTNPSADLVIASSINGGAVTERMRVTSDGRLFPTANSAAGGNVNGVSGELGLNWGTTRVLSISTATEVRIANGAGIGFSSSNSSSDVWIQRDAAQTLAQRNSTNAQTFRVYDTYTSASDYHRLGMATVRISQTATAGATITLTGLIPDGAVVMGVTTKVTTALTGGVTGYQIGTAADADRWGVAATATIGTTTDNRDWTNGTIECFTAATDVILTADGASFSGTGVIYVSIQYLRGESD